MQVILQSEVYLWDTTQFLGTQIGKYILKIETFVLEHAVIIFYIYICYEEASGL